MTDTPGWTSPGSTEPSSEASGPAAGPAPQAAVPQAATPQDAVPQPVIPPQPPAYQGGYGHPGGSGGPGGWGGPPPGWGPQPGWGGPTSGWGVPPSPKPGVIPLRPLSVGELLDGSVSTVRKHWRTVLSLSVALGAVSQTAEAVASWAASDHPGSVVDLLPLLVTVVLSSLLGIIANGLLTIVVSKAVLGQQATLKEAWQGARPRLGRLLGLGLLTSLGAGVLLAVGLVVPLGILLYATSAGNGAQPWMILLFPICLPLLGVAVWLWIKLSLAAPAIVLERQGVLASMRRSWRLSKGSWWRLFGITLLTGLLVSVIGGMAMTPFTIASVMVGGGDGGLFGANAGHLTIAGLVITAVGGTLISAITIPITGAMGVLLYIDQRIRREALDIELARAAGLPEYGGTGWAAQGATVPGPSTPPGA